MERYKLDWSDVKSASAIRYECGYCGTDTSPAFGWHAVARENFAGYVLICTNCNRPSFVELESSKFVRITPAAKLGREVTGLPEDVAGLYNEARSCTSAGAYSAAVLTCRKLLMHVAVEKGAPTGKNFIDYVDYLSTKGYIPPDGKGWLDYIRTKSNEANHEIVLMSHDDADDLLTFTEMLLRLVYEFKQRLPHSSDPLSP